MLNSKKVYKWAQRVFATMSLSQKRLSTKWKHTDFIYGKNKFQFQQSVKDADSLLGDEKNLLLLSPLKKVQQ